MQCPPIGITFVTAIQLFFVGLLILTILFIYAIVSFAFMYNFFNPEDNLFCETTWECYVTVIREGLLNNYGGSVSIMTSSKSK